MKARIGVYICQCGSNISDYVDVEKVRNVVANVNGVVLAKTMMFACADSNQQEIVEDIQKEQLDGLVVASCSPKLHLSTFRNVAERGGLNRYEYVQVNIREQGSWAHSDTPAEATAKAIRSVRAAIARTRLAQALVSPVIPAENRALVVGAGVAGMRAALDLADAGTQVDLIERDHFVGGRTSQWGPLHPTEKQGAEVVASLFREVERRDNITLYTGCEAVSKSGSVGNFSVQLRITSRGMQPAIRNGGTTARSTGGNDFERRLERAIASCPVSVSNEHDFGLTQRKAIYLRPDAVPRVPAIDWRNCTRCGDCGEICPEIDLEPREESKEIEVGAVVVATGFDPYEPSEGEFGFGTIDSVLTLSQFRRLLESSGDRLTHRGRDVQTIAYIYCVGSRQIGALEGNNKYCSRQCCTSAIYAAVLAKRKFGAIQNYHFTRGVRTYGKQELVYEESCRLGDIYFQSHEDNPPVVSAEDGTATIRVTDILTEDKELEVEADLVVLVTGMMPRAEGTIGELLKMPIGRDAFFNEVHPKLRPVETVIDGVFLAGTAQGPKNIPETANAAQLAAVKAHALVSGERIELEPTQAKIHFGSCDWCGKCLDVCPFDAVDRVDRDGKAVAVVNESTCKGCGICLPICPSNAIQLTGFTDAEIETAIDAMAH